METTPATPATPKFGTREQYLALVQAAGLSALEQSGFIKVEAAKGIRVYVAATKTVRRVDVSGFEWALGDVTVPAGKFKQGAVTVVLNLEGGPEKHLERFARLLAHMKTLPAREAPAKPAKVKAAPAAKPAPKQEDAAAKAARLELIRKVAAEKGVPVSPSALASE